MSEHHDASTPTPSRRRCLELGAAAAIAGPLSLLSSSAHATPEGGPRRRSLRFAHLTDVHVQPERGATEGMRQCLHHVQSQSEPVDLVVTGGDSVMDVFVVDADRSKALHEIWRDVLEQDCSLPVRSCIGNHDIRPWAASTEGGLLAGKDWAMELFGLDKRYYSFDQAGWRFLVLDTVQPSGKDYTGGIDEEQLAWIESELAELNGAQPVVVVSHIPILTLTSLTYTEPKVLHGAQQLPGYLMTTNGVAVHRVFREHPNVKLCLSGHTHLRDRCDIDGIAYVCGGAVSGYWWGGPHQKVDEGYGLVDLYDDGSFDYAYTKYGWKAQ